MKNKRFGIVIWRPVAIAALAASMGYSGGAHAVIDYGNTIESVTPSYSESGQGGTLYTSTNASINQHAWVADPKSGLQWIKASTLEEGQSQGFHLATVDEFRTLLLNEGWTPNGSALNEWSLTNGFSYKTGSTTQSGAGYFSSYTSTTNLAAVSFNADAVSNSQQQVMFTTYTTTLSTSLAWLSDGAGGLKAGGWFDQKLSSGSCSYANRSGGCSYADAYAHDAVIANLQDLQNGVYDSSSHATGSNWSSLLAGLPASAQGSSLTYFMVASVPEPSSYALMVLGLTGVGLAARRGTRAKLRSA